MSVKGETDRSVWTSVKKANIRECSIRGYLTKRIKSDRQLAIFVSVLVDFADQKVVIFWLFYLTFSISSKEIYFSDNTREGSGGRGAALLASRSRVGKGEIEQSFHILEFLWTTNSPLDSYTPIRTHIV